MAKKMPPPRSPQLELAGDELSVALLNTAGARPDNRQQSVETYADFVTWSQAVGTVSAPRAGRLRRRAAERPAEAAAAFALVAELRTAVAESFLAAERQEPVDESHLEVFNRALAESSLGPRLIVAESGGGTLAWVGDEDALDSPLGPVLVSAFKILTAEGRPYVRQCAAPGCELFFVDPSGRRKWCSMELCGNRVKTKVYYRRRGKAERQQRRKDAIPKPRKGS